MAVSAQALLDEAARLKERYPDADHMAMAEAVLAERWRCWGIAHRVSEQLGFPLTGNEIANVIVSDIAPVAIAKSRAVPAIAGGHQ